MTYAEGRSMRRGWVRAIYVSMETIRTGTTVTAARRIPDIIVPGTPG
jgi:hypothetical protein